MSGLDKASVVKKLKTENEHAQHFFPSPKP